MFSVFKVISWTYLHFNLSFAHAHIFNSRVIVFISSATRKKNEKTVLAFESNPVGFLNHCYLI